MAPLGFARRARVVGARSFSGRTLLAAIVNAPRSGDRALPAAVRGGARTGPVDGNRRPSGALATALMELINSKTNGAVDITAEQVLARELAAINRLFRRA